MPAVTRRYTLEELARATGIEKRTIRSYMQQGLVRGPEAQGRKAFYTDDHLVRLKALRFLRHYENRSMDEIRGLLLAKRDEEVADLARRFDQMSQAKAGLVTGSPSASSALDYIESLRLAFEPPVQLHRSVILARHAHEARVESPARVFGAVEERREAPGGPGTPVDAVLGFFEKLSAGKPVPRRARGEAWVVIRVTPDLELHVRGVKGADQLARLERIADHLREALLGGLSHD
jgi:DNA-binding transcriptional MerR regulator